MRSFLEQKMSVFENNDKLLNCLHKKQDFCCDAMLSAIFGLEDKPLNLETVLSLHKYSNDYKVSNSYEPFY